MGVRALQAEAESVVLSAPLDANLNHQWTAFGGSIAALAVLASWCLTQIRLEAIGIRARLVIRSSSMDFVRPALDEFVATATPAPDAEWDRFLEMLRRKGRGRIALGAEVTSQDDLVATHEGLYVAFLDESASA
jgi:thioesterase domain-containing protein